MKIRNSCTMLREERDMALFDAYCAAIKERSFKTHKEAVDYVRLSPAPKWFLSADNCAAEISRMIRGLKPLVNRSARIKKYSDLLKAYKKACADPENESCCHYAICEKLVETPAPQWYLGFKHASDIIMQGRRQHNEKIARRLCRTIEQ